MRMWRTWFVALGLCAAWGASPSAAQEPKSFEELTTEYQQALQKWYAALSAAENDDGTFDADKMPPHPSGEYLPRFKRIASEDNGEDGCKALLWLMRNSSGDPPKSGEEHTGQWVLQQLEQRFVDDPCIKQAVSMVGWFAWQLGNDNVERFLKTVLQRNSNKEVRAAALFSLGRVKANVRGAKAEQLKEAETLFKRVQKEYPESEAAKQAGSYLFELQNLQIGMQAPEITGTDANGEKLTLSQFRGQVVVLDFWGFW